MLVHIQHIYLIIIQGDKWDLRLLFAIVNVELKVPSQQPPCAKSANLMSSKNWMRPDESYCTVLIFLQGNLAFMILRQCHSDFRGQIWEPRKKADVTCNSYATVVNNHFYTPQFGDGNHGCRRTWHSVQIQHSVLQKCPSHYGEYILLLGLQIIQDVPGGQQWVERAPHFREVQN